MRRPSAILLFLLLLAVELAAAGKPFIVVFDFESEFDNGEMGKKVAAIFRGHAFRRRIYQTIDDLSFDEVVSGRFKARWSSAPKEVADFARKALQADIVIYGKVTKQPPEQYGIFVRILEISDKGVKEVLNKRYAAAGVHAIPEQIDAALHVLDGRHAPPKVDLLADESWKKRNNLVKNGGFERGKDTPIGWERVDGLCSFWVDGESPTGKCVKFDTDVLGSQFEEWRKKFEAGAPASEAPKKIPPKDPGYNTVGGTVGTHIYSNPIPIKPGMTYRLDFDLRAPKGDTSRLFVKGYGGITEEKYGKQDREIYRAPVTLRVEGNDANKWKHFARLFRPTQSLIVLDFVSEFDNNETGRKLADAIYAAAKRTRKIGIFDRKQVADALASRKVPVSSRSTPADIGLFAGEEFGHAIIVYGEVLRGDGELGARASALDVRRKIVKPLLKGFAFRSSKGSIQEIGAAIAKRIIGDKPAVKFLRIKLDCYWPRGLYYFDNVTLTEEGMGK
ncbi:MAG: hypothetical protein GXP25_14435 [Planctomycetes bacterium]|nr:hypothetical protein [Planctomycetota bacterium]